MKKAIMFLSFAACTFTNASDSPFVAIIPMSDYVIGTDNDEDGTPPITPPAPTGYIQFKRIESGGFANACGLDWNNNLWCGNGTDPNDWTLEASDVTHFSASIYNIETYISNNQLYVRGSNDFGQLGLGHDNGVSSWTRVTDPNIDGKVKDISYTEYSHGLLLDTSGNVWAAGDSWEGELGLGNKDQHMTWQKTPVTNAVKIKASVLSSYALTASGDLMVTGSNKRGQLGLGHNTNVFSWQVSETNVKDFFADGEYSVGAESHAFIIKKDNTVWATGKNVNGQLGLGDTTSRNKFTQIAGLDGTKIKKIVPMSGGAVYLDTNNDLHFSGDISYALKSPDGYTSSTTFYKMLGISNVLDMSGNYGGLILIKDDYTTWGIGYFGSTWTEILIPE